ncbi:hypothetical protein M408DRAFT_332483 [Serendipita vermifera MAFF 305830]|uniref:Transcription factor domain-containing protein n=1 Tax=Serendipita vermifera MAFF 305830 TaxID=933852 RepID=A0A0C3AT47_SERVB|nr:hypothetical protein M408DRAFT_332483 [Serendipita vermifera MAFF 305830]
MSIAPPRLPTPKDREAQLLHVLHTCLPRREICDRLVEYYFEKVEWSITLLHRISFMRAYETFWFLSEDERVKFISPPTPTSATSWGGGFRASFLPPTSDQPSGYGRPGPKSPLPKARSSLPDDGHVTPAWISLLLALLCASLERLGYWDAKSVGIVETVDHYQILCRRLYDGSQGVMIIGDFLKSRALESIQALVLLLHCHQTISNTQWEAQLGTTLSVAVRLGMLMGLNKLSPEKVGSAQRPGLLKRELGRRAWWNLVERDWSLSPRVGHSYAVNPAQNFCDFPANTGWEEFSFRQSAFKQQPRGIWTSASLFLARIDVARGNRELTDQYNSLDGVSYNALLKHEVMMEETVCRAPRQLIKVDGEFELSTPQGQWNRIQFTFHAHYNAITLHRPYIIAALLDVKAEEQRQSNSQTGSSHPRRQTAYLPSLDTAIRSAEVILDTMEEAISSQYPGMQWWQTIICCYTAAVVLLVERWYKLEAKAGTLESEDAEERRRKIQAASALLREQCDAVDLFAQAANALDSLLDATTSARRKARKSGRRGMDINDVVNPVNVSSRASVSSGNTPPFVKEWIDRPNTPMPTPESNPPPPPSSLSTMTLLPGTPLVVDASYDSQFWARIFDLEFQAPPDMADLFFPSYESQGADEMGDQAMANTEGGANGSGVGNLGGSAIWNAVSGSIGSSSNGDGWPRASPYGNTSGS